MRIIEGLPTSAKAALSVRGKLQKKMPALRVAQTGKGNRSSPCRAGCISKCSKRVPIKQNVSDELLLKLIADGDKLAMHDLFKRYRIRVFRFIQRMIRDHGLVDDLVSQVFLDVWRSANKFEGRAQVSTWLLQIARFKALNSIRKKKREIISLSSEFGAVDASDTPEEALRREEANKLLDACIGKLHSAHRNIIDLFYYREKTVDELSEMLGVPQGTIKSRMFCARKQLARNLIRAGLDVADV